MTIRYIEMTTQEQAIWNAAYGAHFSIRGNGAIAWEIADAAVEAYRKWYEELVDLEDERVTKL